MKITIGDIVIVIIYDGTGMKLSKETFANGQKIDSTHYVNGLEYFSDTLKIFHADGVIEKKPDNTVEYYYYFKDYKGDVRYFFIDKNGDGIVSVNEREEQHYYPFGIEVEGAWMKVEERNPYLLNGKEFDKYAGLNAFGARWQDPALGRFINVDRFSENFAFQSSYFYAANNPILYNDINGDSINVTLIQRYDNTNNSTLLQTILSDLESQTGLIFTIFLLVN